jgi:hypothetical protein
LSAETSISLVFGRVNAELEPEVELERDLIRKGSFGTRKELYLEMSNMITKKRHCKEKKKLINHMKTNFSKPAISKPGVFCIIFPELRKNSSGRSNDQKKNG